MELIMNISKNLILAQLQKNRIMLDSNNWNPESLNTLKNKVLKLI